MERKTQVKQQIETFITSSHEERLNLCTFGVEIETQVADPSDMDESEAWSIIYDSLEREQYLNEDQWQLDLSDKVLDFLSWTSVPELMGFISTDNMTLPTNNYPILCYNQITGKLIQDNRKLKNLYKRLIIDQAKAINDRAEALGIDIDSEEWKLSLINKWKHVWGELEDIQDFDRLLCDYCIEEDIESCMRDYEGNYYYPLEEIMDDYPHLFNGGLWIDNDFIETGNDPSVTGVEIRTIGGLSHKDFKYAADVIFHTIDSSDHYIDWKCSAHIHLKLGDINHYYGDGKLHGAIMEYLAFALPEMPESVQDRLLNYSNSNICPRLVDAKLTWVRFHPQKTIEFRLFGNIDNTEDLLVCQKIALDALAYGYQVRFGDYERALSNEELELTLRSA